MTALGFAMMVMAMVLHAMNTLPGERASPRLGLLMIAGVMLFVLGITRFLWEHLP